MVGYLEPNLPHKVAVRIMMLAVLDSHWREKWDTDKQQQWLLCNFLLVNSLFHKVSERDYVICQCLLLTIPSLAVFLYFI